MKLYKWTTNHLARLALKIVRKNNNNLIHFIATYMVLAKFRIIRVVIPLLLNKMRQKKSSLTIEEIDSIIYEELNIKNFVKTSLKFKRTNIYQVKNLLSIIRFINNMELFENILMQFDNDLKFVKYQSADFLPKASGGDGSLDVYRKITLQTQDVLFEKIYLKQSEYYNKLEIFYTKILPQINHLIKVPKLEYVHKGRDFVSCCFEFVTSKPTNKNNIYEITLPILSGIYNKSLQIPKELKSDEFIKEHLYKQGFEKASKMFGLSNIKKIEDIIVSYPHVLAHGDLNTAHVYENGYFIDWDRFGIYPIGYDIGMLLSRYNAFESLKALVDFIDLNILDKIDSNIDKKEFKIGCLYFSFIFYSRKVNIKVEDDFLDEIYDLLVGVLINEIKYTQIG